MTTIKDIFQNYGPEYMQQFGDNMPAEHRNVIDAIINCRTQHFGATIYQCEECRQKHTVYCSCGNRHCPNCQHHKTHLWLTKQMEKQLPGHHFMVTFTVPEEIRRVIRSNQRICYSAMFRASSDTIKKLAADKKYIGGDFPGFTGVLHTWGRQLHYHPHIHYIVPGGAMSKIDGLWYPSRVDFLLPVKAMSKIFKTKFSDEMRKNELFPQIPSEVWKKAWIVNCQAVGNGENSFKYLSSYVFKVAISNRRIIKVEDGKVYFKYRKNHSRRWRTMALKAMEFLRRFLQNVLPSGFMKIRYYGFLHSSCKIPLKKVSTLIELAYGFKVVRSKTRIEPFEFPKCENCGGNLKYVTSIRHYDPILAGSG